MGKVELVGEDDGLLLDAWHFSQHVSLQTRAQIAFPQLAIGFISSHEEHILFFKSSFPPSHHLEQFPPLLGFGAGSGFGAGVGFVGSGAGSGFGAGVGFVGSGFGSGAGSGAGVVGSGFGSGASDFRPSEPLQLEHI